MARDHDDDDVIVINEDDVADESPDENGSPADSAGAPARDDTIHGDAASGAGRAPDEHPAASDPYSDNPVTPIRPGLATQGTEQAFPGPGTESGPAASPAAASPAPAANENWPQIQALFVDDPHSAVRQAADVASGAAAALVAAVKNREQTLRDGWQADATGTEELRTALREYRQLASRLSTWSRGL
jgi:hypothetical protein